MIEQFINWIFEIRVSWGVEIEDGLLDRDELKVLDCRIRLESIEDDLK